MHAVRVRGMDVLFYRNDPKWVATGSAELALALVCSEQLESRMMSLRVETCHWTANMHPARVHSFTDATCGCLVLPQRFPQ